MTLEIKKIKTSSFELPRQTEQVEQLQRTDKWKEDRNGCWNGSRIKDLMACNRKGASLSWDMPDKIKMFSSGIISQVYEIAMQRKRGQWIEVAADVNMKYGTKVEPLIDVIASEIMKHKGIIKEVGSKPFKDFPTARASSDGVLFVNDTPIATCEKKACVSWSSHYKRTFELMDEKSIDFWQTQMQMMAWEVNTGYYFVASPPKDKFKYLNYAGDIMDLLEDFRNECEVTVQEIKASPFHQNAMFERIKICEMAVEKWINTGGRLDDVFYGITDGTYGIVKCEIEEKNDFNPDDVPF